MLVLPTSQAPTKATRTVILFEIEMENISGTLTICLPYAAIEPIVPKLRAQFQSEEQEVDHEVLDGEVHDALHRHGDRGRELRALRVHNREEGVDDARDAPVNADHDGPACNVQDRGDALANAAVVHVAHDGDAMHSNVWASRLRPLSAARRSRGPCCAHTPERR